MKKGIGTERKEAAITNQTGGGAGAERSSEATLFFFLSFYMFPLTFYSLTLQMIYFSAKNWMGGKKSIQSINNLGIKKSAGCLLRLGSLEKGFCDAWKMTTAFLEFRSYFLLQGTKCSHKQWLAQAYNTSVQASVWCRASEQIQPMVRISMLSHIWLLHR